MNRMFTAIVLSLGVSSFAFAGVKVTSLDLNTTSANGFINIAVEGRSPELPDIKVLGKTIEVTLDKAEPFVAISKTVKGAFLSANSLNGKAVVRVTLPYAVSPESINLAWQNKKIEIIYSKLNLTKNNTENVAPLAAKAAVQALPKMAKSELNESYLNSLMNEKVEPKNAPIQKKILKNEIKVKQSANNKKPSAAVANKTDSFSFVGYAVKFSVFLAMVLGLFYGIVQLLKKGIFKRGKLGFLNNTQMIEVLSTTYVSPKRSLMIVKAHKQIFLVANSESGLEFLSEMKDTSGLIKEGEKEITGSNFDTNLDQLEKSEETFSVTLKENIEISTSIEERKSITDLTAKDIVKFSDELKKKAKKLKPIEFN